MVETGLSTRAPNRRTKPAPRRAGMTWRADWERGVCFREMGWDWGEVDTRTVVAVSVSLDARGLVVPLAMEEDIVTGSMSGILGGLMGLMGDGDGSMERWVVFIWRTNHSQAFDKLSFQLMSGCLMHTEPQPLWTPATAGLPFIFSDDHDGVRHGL